MLQSKGEKAFTVINSIFLTLLAILCISPMIYMLAVSFSSNAAVVSGKVLFWPVDFNTASYEYLMSYASFWQAMWVSVKRVVLSLILTLVLTVLSAYPLSKDSDRFLGRTVFAWIFFIPMLVNGGLIPTYMVIRTLGLLGTIWALVLPAGVVTFYVLLMLNFFRGVPKEMEEAAMIDGAGQWKILVSIYLPVSLPVLATVAVYCILGQWNDWFQGIIYSKAPSQYPLMSYLQAFALNLDLESLSTEQQQKLSSVGSDTYQAAQLFVATIPMVLIYPFFQKYFASGLTVGSVKG